MDTVTDPPLMNVQERSGSPYSRDAFSSLETLEWSTAASAPICLAPVARPIGGGGGNVLGLHKWSFEMRHFRWQTGSGFVKWMMQW